MKSSTKTLIPLTILLATSLFAQEEKNYTYTVPTGTSTINALTDGSWSPSTPISFDSNTNVTIAGSSATWAVLDFKQEILNLKSLDSQWGSLSSITTSYQTTEGGNTVTKSGTINISAENFTTPSSTFDPTKVVLNLTGNSGLAGKGMNVNIGGAVSLAYSALGDARGDKGEIGRLRILGNTYINTINTATDRWGTFYTQANGTLYNPDAIFKGVVTTNQTSARSLEYGSGWASGTIQSAYAWVNGFDKNVGFTASGKNAAEGATVTLVLTNDQDRYSSGSIGTTATSSTPLPSIINITMMSASYDLDADGNVTNLTYTNNAQHFTGDEMNFAGGVTIKSGSLYLNYRGTSTNESHGKLILNKEGLAQTAIFGNSNTADTSNHAKFVFDSIEVGEGGGTIKVAGSGIGGYNDIIYAKDGITGTGTITLSFDDALEFKYEGDGDSSEWYKIIEWDSGKTNTANIIAEDAIIEDGQYVFKYDDRIGDGLYVAYVAVPEPSTYAAIFGALALGFAFYRRRK